MRNIGRNWKYGLAAAVFIILVLLIMDFNSRMAELRRLTADKERVSLEVTHLVSTQQALETQIAYATSEAAVYKWAYESQRMVHPEDQLVVPIPAPGNAPQPTPTLAPTAQVVQNWQVWLSLFTNRLPGVENTSP
jgi:hypothetical protein